MWGAARGATLAQWTFDDGTGRDMSGNGHDLATAGTVSFANGYAPLRDDGRNFLRTTDNLPLADKEAVTIECWARTKRLANAVFVCLDNNGADGNVYLGIEKDSSTGWRLRACMNAQSAGSDAQIDDRRIAAEVDGRWHHYVVVYDRSKTAGAFGRLYIDGVQIGETSDHTKWNGVLSGAFPNMPLVIGKYLAKDDDTYLFKGDIDHVRVTARIPTTGRARCRSSS